MVTELPVRVELVPHESFGPEFYDIESHPKLVLRVCGGQKGELAPWVRHMALLRDMTGRRGIPIPDVNVVMSEGKGRWRTRALVFVERIQGEPLASLLPAAPDDLMSEVDALLDDLLSHLAECHESGGWYLTDLHIGQFVFGRRASDGTDRVWLVDVDPLHKRFDRRRTPDPRQLADLHGRVAELANLVVNVEALSSRHLRVARKKALEVVDQLGSRSPKAAERMNRIREVLADGIPFRHWGEWVVHARS